VAQIRWVAHEIAWVEIGVRDLDRSLELYSGLLGFPHQVHGDGRRVAELDGGAGVVRLVEIGPTGRPDSWIPDNRQLGIRHFGMKVAEIDPWADRLSAAGFVPYLGPFDAFGGVRILFFTDPDGACLELVQGYVQHNDLWSAALARREVDGDRGWDGTPRFDHIAITVPDIDEAVRTYSHGLGFGGIGRLVRDEDPTGFLITNLRAGDRTTLEMFSFEDPVSDRPGAGHPDQLGLRAIGIRGDGPDLPPLGPGTVPLRTA
jgi:catechol 2,3-dioxygenase-like lactoylglutathione lyase family enzyme